MTQTLVIAAQQRKPRNADFSAQQLLNAIAILENGNQQLSRSCTRMAWYGFSLGRSQCAITLEHRHRNSLVEQQGVSLTRIVESVPASAAQCFAPERP